MRPRERHWPYDALATYHGWLVDEPASDRPEDKGPGIVAVELSEFGPTERQGTIELYRLAPPAHSGFHWGYMGGGPWSVADVLLPDSLGVKPWGDMQRDFVADVLSQLTDEWRLRRSAVLRWVRGWVAEHGDPEVLPPTLADLPPADPSLYQEAPERIRDERHRRVFGRPRR